MRFRIGSSDAKSSGKDGKESVTASPLAALGAIVDFKRKYHSKEFPNVERRNCPPPNSLRDLIRSGGRPGAELRAHLFKCSDCFRYYRTTLESHRRQGRTATKMSGCRALFESFMPRRLVLAGFFALIILLSAGAYVWPKHIRRAVEPCPDVYTAETSAAEPGTPGKPADEDDRVQTPTPTVAREGKSTPKRSPRTVRSNDARLRPTGRTVNTSTEGKTVRSQPLELPFTTTSRPNIQAADYLKVNRPPGRERGGGLLYPRQVDAGDLLLGSPRPRRDMSVNFGRTVPAACMTRNPSEGLSVRRTPVVGGRKISSRPAKEP